MNTLPIVALASLLATGPLPSTSSTDDPVVEGLRGPVSIELDRNAIPTIDAGDPNDAWSGLGWMHARERFFQMDLARRSAAGELAALAGPLLVDADRGPAMARRRETAVRFTKALPPGQRQLLDRYVAGVNAGLASLETLPIEYRLLNARPAPWTPADSILVVLSMFDQLQDSAAQEPSVMALRRLTTPEVSEWMLSVPGRWDALLVEADEREFTPARPALELKRSSNTIDRRSLAASLPELEEWAPGSNSFAVAGARSRDGRAIVANDPHLAYLAPGIWYRAAVSWPGTRAIGLSLPGVPGLPVGATEHLSWGLTNTTGDFEDLVLVDVDPEDPDRYRVDGGTEAFDDREIEIDVAGAANVKVRSRFTRWGPVLETLPDGRPVALLRVADQPGAVDLGIVDLLEARGLDSGLDLAAAWDGPSQNIVVADAEGRIGWTISGYLPDRRGYDGLSPVTHLEGRGWFGRLPEDLRPRLADPPNGVLHTANNRLVPLAQAARLGKVWADGGRGWRIRADMEAIETMTELDLLEIQLDETIQRFLPYRDLLLQGLARLDEEAPGRREVLAIVSAWDGRASAADLATPIVQSFRATLLANARAALLARFAQGDEADITRSAGLAAQAIRTTTLLAAIEGADRELLPAGDRARGWEGLLEDAATVAVATHLEDPTTPWAERNRNRSRHPLGMAHPLVGDRFDLPSVPQPGHWGAVRVQSGGFGASARFVASPTHLEDGLLTTPGGQSGLPGSSHYADLHDAWANGAPSPLLPGPAVETTTLRPGPN